MRNCTNCEYAIWQRTRTGKLHPSGRGRCGYPYRIPALPASMYWITIIAPTPYGGWINRREELKDHCAYYSEKHTGG